MLPILSLMKRICTKSPKVYITIERHNMVGSYHSESCQFNKWSGIGGVNKPLTTKVKNKYCV